MSQQASNVATGLLDWFVVHARDLPWRHCRDAYGIWVSEVMLQQTQVQTVIPYWQRWMRELPTVAALANVPESQLLKLWEGLGYYSRARNLQKAAQLVNARHGGTVPSTTAELMDLPGVGPYTAGAIASLAFNQPEPLVDGNVARVIARLRMVEGDPREPDTKTTLWSLATQLVHATGKLRSVSSTPLACGRFSILNQALMELGATVCTPRTPSCDQCPIRNSCQAFASGAVERFPALAPRVKATRLRYAVAVLHRSGKWFLRQRGAGDVNHGLWEFPQLELPPRPSNPVRKIAEWLDIPENSLHPLPRIRHAITRYQITLEVYEASVLKTPASLGQGHWLSAREIEALAMTSAHRKIATRALEGSTERHLSPKT